MSEFNSRLFLLKKVRMYLLICSDKLEAGAPDACHPGPNKTLLFYATFFLCVLLLEKFNVLNFLKYLNICILEKEQTK